MQLKTLYQALGILESLTDEQIKRLPRAERERMSNQCLRASIKLSPMDKPPAGPALLQRLRDGRGYN